MAIIITYYIMTLFQLYRQFVDLFHPYMMVKIKGVYTKKNKDCLALCTSQW